jgi:succinate dehydrogenase / fumarate reductase cytochrome b subunit
MEESKVEVNQSQTDSASKGLNLLSWFKPFSRGIGMYAWLFQRLTGLFLVMYVFMHLGIIGTMLLDEFLGFTTPGLLYNSITSAMSSSFVEGMGYPKPIEHALSIAFFIDAGLLAGLVYHGYNGIRVVLFDLGIGIRQQKTIFWILFILGVISWILAVWLILNVDAIVTGV